MTPSRKPKRARFAVCGSKDCRGVTFKYVRLITFGRWEIALPRLHRAGESGG